MVAPFQAKPPKALLVGLSFIAYEIGGATAAHAFSVSIKQVDLDRHPTMVAALIYSTLLWMSGGIAGAVGFDLAKQLRFWPVTIGAAALHGVVFMMIMLVLLGGKGSFDPKAAWFLMLGGSAAAIGYTVYLVTVTLIWPRACRP